MLDSFLPVLYLLKNFRLQQKLCVCMYVSEEREPRREVDKILLGTLELVLMGRH